MNLIEYYKQRLNEMAATKALMKRELGAIRRAERNFYNSRGAEEARALRAMHDKWDEVQRILASPNLYDVGSNPTTRKIVGKLPKGAPGRYAAAASFGHKLEKGDVKAAKEMANKHGLFYVARDWDDPGASPFSTLTAIGGKRGPRTPFIRTSRNAARFN
jgi:hypothetical protein